MSEMNDFEKLAIAQAVYKAVGAAVGTRDPDNLRGRCDAEARRAFEEDGVKSRDLRVNGVKVGTLTAKETADTRATVLRVKDRDDFTDWVEGNMPDEVIYEVVVRTKLAGVADKVFEAAKDAHRETVTNGGRSGGCERIAYSTMVIDEHGVLEKCVEDGVVPDGCEVVDVGEAPRYGGTTVRVSVPKVANALGGTLTGAMANLLTDGGDE